MSAVQRAVYIGGPSHGEISGGNFDLGENEVVYGPQPAWWDWSQPYHYRYQPTGTLAAGMLVYEHVPDVPVEPVRAVNEGKLVEAGFDWAPQRNAYVVTVGDTDEYGFQETWFISHASDFFDSLREHGYKIDHHDSQRGWVVYRP